MPPSVASSSMPTTERRRPKWSNKKPHGICMAAKPKKKAPVSAPQGFWPDGQVAHQVQADGDVEARKKWAAI
jgi:hypothetical protein